MQIAIVSGKGGTGKSTVSAALVSLAKNVVLADCDVDAANLYIIFDPQHEKETPFVGGEKAVIDKSKCTNCGICVDYCRFEAIEWVNGEVTISEVACDGCHLCSRICPEKAISIVEEDDSRLYSGTFRYGKMVYGILAAGEENSGLLVNAVREEAEKVAEKNNLDTIIIDGPPGIGCPVISAITGVDKTLIVTEPTLSGFYDLERIKEVLDHFKIPAKILINKYDINEEISAKIEQWALKNNSEVIGKIPFHKDVVTAMTNKQTMIEFDKNHEISQIFRNIYDKIKK